MAFRASVCNNSVLVSPFMRGGGGCKKQLRPVSMPPCCASYHAIHGDEMLLRMPENVSESCRQQSSSASSRSQFRKPRPKEWNPMQRLAADLLDAIEAKLVDNQEKKRCLPRSVDPNVQISGNFAPVEESCVQAQLQVVGHIPHDLDGVYVRNGANPRFKPSAGHHLFDGDGMIHAVKFSRGNASYCCRYTRTYRLCQEEKVGRSFFPKPIGGLHGHAGVARLLLYYARTLMGLLDLNQGIGVANAGLIFFNGTLLAMSEDDLPYAVHVTDSGDLTTLGRFNFQGQLKSPMIAHPKIDPETGEMFVLSYNVVAPPYLKYFYFSPTGIKSEDVVVPLRGPTMMHDFAITAGHVIIPDQQMVFRLEHMLRGGSPVAYDRRKTSRFGIMPKYMDKQKQQQPLIQWIDVPDCFCFHLWNAWEENDGQQIVVIGSCMTPPDAIFSYDDHDDDDDASSSFRSVLSEIRLDRASGTSRVTPIVQVDDNNMNMEAGQVNRRLQGRHTRYAYMALAEPWPKVSGVAKVDLQRKAVLGVFRYGDQCYGGEPYFVPRTRSRKRQNDSHVDVDVDVDVDVEEEKEDDGYLLTFVFDESRGCSRLLVLDASCDQLPQIASVSIPSRVPYGFHGTYIPFSQLAMQSTAI